MTRLPTGEKLPQITRLQASTLGVVKQDVLFAVYFASAFKTSTVNLPFTNPFLILASNWQIKFNHFK